MASDAPTTGAHTRTPQFSHLSRRGLLAAAAPLACAITAAPPPPPGQRAWATAVARDKAAWKRLDTHPIHTMLPGTPEYIAAEDDETIAVRVSIIAEEAMFALPAPDLAAVIYKLETYLTRQDGPDEVRIVLGDLRRLIDGGC